MTRVLTDEEIAQLLAEPKPLPGRWRARLKPRQKSNQSFTQAALDVDGRDGNRFRIVVRGNRLNPQDFSILLLFIDSDGTAYCLTRFNGRHPSEHTNKWEKWRGLSNAKFKDAFHKHFATERYQLAGYAIDGYAEVTDQYDSLDSALERFVRSNGIVVGDAGNAEDATLFEQDEETNP